MMVNWRSVLRWKTLCSDSFEGGGPVQIVYPSDGTAFHADAMALVAGAPNEGNGKAFLDFMMSC